MDAVLTLERRDLLRLGVEEAQFCQRRCASGASGSKSLALIVIEPPTPS
jgi:hypothetical protein